MIKIENATLLTIEESMYIDGVFCLAYEGKQVSMFMSYKDINVMFAWTRADLDNGIIRELSEFNYTHKMDLQAYAFSFRIVTVGDQDYVFAYTTNGDTCDIFQHNNRDFEIDELAIQECKTPYEGLTVCIGKYNEWRHSLARKKKFRQVI
jgi:hypothetical protein